jgi:hypothetical protein
MPKLILTATLLSIVVHLIAPPPFLFANQCSRNTYGISTLRGDAHYPPDWDPFGGALLIRKPYVQLHATGSTFLIKGIEFDVMNNSTIGASSSPNRLVDGSLQLVIRYLPHDGNTPKICFIPKTHIFEENASQAFQIRETDYTSEPINTQYIHLTALIPDLADYIPANARDMALMLIYSGSFDIDTPIPVALGSYGIDPAIENSTRLAYARQPAPLRPGIIASVLPDGSDERPLTQWLATIDNGWSGHWSPEWSPDGNQLVFNQTMCQQPDINNTTCSRIKDGNINYSSEITLLETAAGTLFPANIVDTFRIEDEPFWALEGYMPIYSPSFSPGSDQLAVTAQSDVLEFLVIMDAASGSWHVTPDCPDRASGGSDCWHLMYNAMVVHSPPSWNPHDNTIAVTLGLRADDTVDDGTHFAEIFTIHPDGSQFTRLTNDNFLDHHPTWTPDGQWIAFVSDRDGGHSTDIWMMDRNGENLQKVLDCAANCTSPTFSPDGRHIAFSQAGIVKKFQLGTTTVTQVTTDATLADAPDWSPYLDEHAPSIAMTADKLKIGAGEAVTLTYTGANAERIVIDNGIGEQQTHSGTLTVYPTTTTTYTIAAHNWAGRATATVTILIEAP